MDIERISQAATATKAAAISSGGATAFFGLSMNEFAAAVGATIAVLTFLTNLYFNTKRLRLVEEQIRRERETN